ncbi:MAG: mandelate racemase/muconate lactonizing enzyme family protein [Rhizobiales bacterium]|nr:mandelate racemase/muconate lactonizing enzyme family protein [Hyphomicrobiales bacterium]
MNITRIEVWNFAPPFRDGPYVMSHVTQEFAYGRIIRVHADNGLTGLGEIVFAPSSPPELRLTQISSEPNYLPELIGQNIDSLNSAADTMRSNGKPWCGIAFGLETAWFDLVGKDRDQPIAELLGEPQTNAISGYFSVSERTPEDISKRIAGTGPGTKVIQLKIGIGSIDDDEAHVTAALKAMRDDQLLLADANGGWTIDHAREIAARFHDPRIVWEEPCRQYDDNAKVARTIAEPVMVDQCVGDLVTATRAADEAVAHSLCIKPAFLGGLNPGRQIRDLCAARNMQLRIDGPWCGDIATAAILHLALGAPTGLLIAGADLREPLTIEPGLNGICELPDGRVAPQPGPGLGINIGNNTLGPPEAVYGS